MAQTPTLSIRADLTDAELGALRKIAIDEGRRVSQLVADALRAAYPLTPADPLQQRADEIAAADRAEEYNHRPLTPKEQSE